MFSLFKERPRDVKKTRSVLLDFIKEKLQRAEGGEGERQSARRAKIFCAEGKPRASRRAVAPGRNALGVSTVAVSHAVKIGGSARSYLSCRVGVQP